MRYSLYWGWYDQSEGDAYSKKFTYGPMYVASGEQGATHEEMMEHTRKPMSSLSEREYFAMSKEEIAAWEKEAQTRRKLKPEKQNKIDKIRSMRAKLDDLKDDFPDFVEVTRKEYDRILKELEGAT